MKPYLYILGVLLVGGGIGYFIGQKSAILERKSQQWREANQNDESSVREVLFGLSEAYRLHDSLLLFKDCANTYVEIDGITGEARGLEKSVLASYELFRTGQSVAFSLKDIDVKILHNSALVRAGYSKTSEIFEKEGITGLLGQGLWIMSKSTGKWQIDAFWQIEESKR
jgi:hypothetical protein